MAAGKKELGFGWSEWQPQPTHPLEKLISGPLTTKETSGAEGGFLHDEDCSFFMERKSTRGKDKL